MPRRCATMSQQQLREVYMLIQIVSKNIDVSPALTARINERFDEMMDKYIRREGEAQVSVSREGTGFRTVCSVHLPSGAT